jgi:FMN phosphatase YigB (HAD superfamily)
MPVKLVAFDWGHTLMDERRDADVPLDTRPVHLMPGVSAVLPQIGLPLALWANTRVASASDLRRWLERAGLSHHFQSITTSIDAGARKPAARFFECALAQCGAASEEALFVGNQLNTDIAGAVAFGIRTVWLSDAQFRSTDDVPNGARATYTIPTLLDLPALLRELQV